MATATSSEMTMIILPAVLSPIATVLFILRIRQRWIAHNIRGGDVLLGVGLALFLSQSMTALVSAVYTAFPSTSASISQSFPNTLVKTSSTLYIFATVMLKLSFKSWLPSCDFPAQTTLLNILFTFFGLLTLICQGVAFFPCPSTGLTDLITPSICINNDVALAFSATWSASNAIISLVLSLCASYILYARRDERNHGRSAQWGIYILLVIGSVASILASGARAYFTVAHADLVSATPLVALIGITECFITLVICCTVSLRQMIFGASAADIAALIAARSRPRSQIVHPAVRSAVKRWSSRVMSGSGAPASARTRGRMVSHEPVTMMRSRFDGGRKTRRAGMLVTPRALEDAGSPLATPRYETETPFKEGSKEYDYFSVSN